jgi:2-polyprenyl-3-methyl-5-hydroxy-6-metoxy-1,4-benzoquinol methylase
MYIKRKDLKETVSNLSIICGTYIKYIAKTNGLKQGDYDLKDGTKCFGFIPYPYNSALNYTLTNIYNKFDRSVNWPKFLDIGCGIGNIVMLANLIGFTSDGIEYDPKIYKVAKHLELYRSTIFKGDMRKFKRYHEYDVLYYYRPILCDEAMKKFSHKLAETVKPGAYVICNGDSEGFKQSKDFEFDENVRAWHKKEELYG